MSKGKLKPCPFCGAPGHRVVTPAFSYAENTYKCAAYCTRSGCKAAIDFIYTPPKWVKSPERQAKAEISKAWNRRAADTLAPEALPAPPAPADDPAPDVLMFIGRFSTNGQEVRQEVIEAFTRGCCFWFAYILAARFGQQYGAEIVINHTAGHFATRIGGRIYDITGDITDTGTWEPWAECNDARLREWITQDCIMF